LYYADTIEIGQIPTHSATMRPKTSELIDTDSIDTVNKKTDMFSIIDLAGTPVD
jgi:hypothetical protein